MIRQEFYKCQTQKEKLNVRFRNFLFEPQTCILDVYVRGAAFSPAFYATAQSKFKLPENVRIREI